MCSLLNYYDCFVNLITLLNDVCLMYLLIYYHCIGSQPTEYVLRGKARVGIFFSAHVRLTEYVLSVIVLYIMILYTYSVL